LVPAAVITIVMVLALFAYAMTSSTDFTLMGGALFVFVSILLVGSIIGYFFYSKTFELILACLGVFMFSLYLIFDI
jgi:FtsH-binding integral membrane protein